MKNLLAACLLSASLISFTSCGDKSHDEHADTTGTSAVRNDAAAEATVKFASVADASNDGKVVTVDGYLAPPDTAFVTEQMVDLNFVENAGDARSSINLAAAIKVGDGNNTIAKVALPYNSKDITVTGNSGEKIAIGDRVRITGQVRQYNGGCSVEVTKISKL